MTLTIYDNLKKQNTTNTEQYLQMKPRIQCDRIMTRSVLLRLHHFQWVEQPIWLLDA